LVAPTNGIMSESFLFWRIAVWINFLDQIFFKKAAWKLPDIAEVDGLVGETSRNGKR